jgi:hypothetical protein
MEIIQNDTPTKSSDFKLEPAAAKALLDDSKPIRTIERVLSFFDFSLVSMRKFFGKNLGFDAAQRGPREG